MVEELKQGREGEGGRGREGGREGGRERGRGRREGKEGGRGEGGSKRVCSVSRGTRIHACSCISL